MTTMTAMTAITKTITKTTTTRRQRRRRRLRPRGTRQYTKRRRRSASVHETIVDEKLAPSGRDEERESRRREIARDTHVHRDVRVRVCARGCTERAGTRENEEERERKKGNRDTSDHGGDSPAHALLPQKLAHYEHERKKKVRTDLLCTNLPSRLPPLHPRQAVVIFSLQRFFLFFSTRSSSLFLSCAIYVRVCVRVIIYVCTLHIYARICTSIPVTCLILGVRVHARDGKRTSRTEMRKG